MQEIENWLKDFLKRNGASAGTVHQQADTDTLELVAAHHIPPPVIEKTRIIPKGKGMAGLAWERNAPVSTCNLKEDKTGDVRPGAKAVDANAAVALPIHSTNGQFRGIVGLAYADERELSPDDLSTLTEDARRVLELLPEATTVL